MIKTERCSGCNKSCMIGAMPMDNTKKLSYVPAINESIVTGYADEKGARHQVQPCETIEAAINLVKHIVTFCCYNSRNVK